MVPYRVMEGYGRGREREGLEDEEGDGVMGRESVWKEEGATGGDGVLE